MASAKPTDFGLQSNTNAIHSTFHTRQVLFRRLSCTNALAMQSECLCRHHDQ